MNFYSKVTLFSILSVAIAWGQFDTGQISGFVKDESDATIVRPLAVTAERDLVAVLQERAPLAGRKFESLGAAPCALE